MGGYVAATGIRRGATAARGCLVLAILSLIVTGHGETIAALEATRVAPVTCRCSWGSGHATKSEPQASEQGSRATGRRSAPRDDPGADGGREGAARTVSAQLAGPLGPGPESPESRRGAEGLGKGTPARAAADTLRKNEGVALQLLSRVRGHHGGRPRRDGCHGPPGAGLRRLPRVEFRRLRFAGAAPRLRYQRFRRDIACSVGVGREALGGEPR